VYFQNSTIHFTDSKPGQTYNLAVPNAVVTFSPSATCASTTFDTVSQSWQTVVPMSGDDEIFLTGLAFPVPVVGISGGISNVSWQGTFSSDVSGVKISWKWGAAVYTSFSTNYNALGVKAAHHVACGISNGDHAGTPENFAIPSNVIGGARGGGASNFTGSWSGTEFLTPACVLAETSTPGAWLLARRSDSFTDLLAADFSRVSGAVFEVRTTSVRRLMIVP